MDLRAAKLSDIGISKEVNQDAALLKYAQLNGENVMFAVVADGMGGLACGEVASSEAIKLCENWYKEDLVQILLSEDIEEYLLDSWEGLLNMINKEILKYGREHQISLGTTLTASLFYRNKMYAVNIGDSRIYKINKAKGLRQITKDDTWLQAELDSMPEDIAMDISKKEKFRIEREQDHRAEMLTQCLGYMKDIDPRYYTADLEAGDFYCICSDGFRHKLDISDYMEMIEMASKNMNLKEILSIKIDYVKEMKERDNITAILIKVNNNSEYSTAVL